MSASRGDAWKQMVHRSLRVQVRIFLVIFLITRKITIERIITREVNPLWAALGFAIGAAIGVVLARSKPLAWDQTKAQVVASNTVAGFILLALYLLFVFTKSDIISRWVEDAAAAGVIGMALTSGVMFGRIRTTFRGVRGVLRSATPAPPDHHPDGS